MEGMIRVTGLWKSKDKAGNTFLSGSLSPISKVLVMPNTYKNVQDGDKAPDYFLYIGAPEKKDAGKSKPEHPKDDL